MAERPLLLNHVEMVYRPGEVDHARAYFETLGFGVTQWESWLVVKIDPENGNGLDNVMYANEPTPAQQNFDAALEEALATNERLAETLERQQAIRQRWPFYNFHFGASIPTHEEWVERVERLREANRSHPLLKGRLDLAVFNPGDEAAVGPQSQAFVHTDILACGPFCQGLLFEIQWTPSPEEGELTFEWLASIAPTNKLPKMEDMV